MSNPDTIVRLQSHQNRTPTGRASATATRHLVNYLAYGRGTRAQQAQREQRGVWYDQNRQHVAHEEILEWVRQQGKEHLYTHQLILSAKEADLTPDAYNEALSAGGGFFSEWRLMRHTDSPYPHAHVISFGDNKIHVKSPLFREWWLTVRHALDARQHERLAALEAEISTELEPFPQERAQQLRYESDLGWEM